MRTSTGPGTEQQKQAYEKPILRRISLLSEEVMAIGCKLPVGNGPAGGGSCLTPVTCSAPGS